MYCPECGSEDTQRLEVVFDQGVSHTTTRGSVRKTFSVLPTAQVNTKSVSISRSARKAAPPISKSIAGPLIVVGIGLLMVLSSISSISTLWILTIIGLVAIAGGVQIFRKNQDFNKNEFPSIFEKWQQSWMCNKCGNIFAAR